jgi:hypothetical protein
VAVRHSDLIEIDGPIKPSGKGAAKTWLPSAIQRICFGDGFGFVGFTEKLNSVEAVVGKECKKRGVLATSVRVYNLVGSRKS